jgi:hypothetical protein
MVIYCHEDGRLYELGVTEEWELWKEVGYQGMGSVELVADLLRSAERSGIKEKSIPWYLLCDVESEV